MLTHLQVGLNGLGGQLLIEREMLRNLRSGMHGQVAPGKASRKRSISDVFTPVVSARTCAKSDSSS